MATRALAEDIPLFSLPRARVHYLDGGGEVDYSYVQRSRIGVSDGG